eukprot:1184381-Prorocentrum_lima.AAC.1
MRDVEPITDRILRITFEAFTPITVINANAPSAYKSDIEKDKFYIEVNRQFDKWKNRGPTFLFGDWNAA